MVKTKKKSLHDSLHLLAKSSLVVFIGIVLSKILSYLYKVIIAREFGPDIYGLFVLAITITGILVVFASLGLIEGLSRYVPLYTARKEMNKVKNIVKFALIITGIFSVFVGLALFLLSDYLSVSVFHNSALEIYLRFFSVTVPLGVISNLYLAIIRANKNISRYSFIINIFQNAIRLVLLVLLMLIGYKSNSISLSYVLSFLALIIAAYYGSRIYTLRFIGLPELKNEHKRQIIGELIKYSWPIIFFGAISNLFTWIDTFVIGYYMTAADVGFYNVAITISTMFSIAPELFMQLFLPLVVEHFSKKRFNDIREISKQVAKWIFALNMPLLLIALLFPGVIINVLFGKEYLTAIVALQILSFGQFISTFVVGISNNLLSMKGKSKVILANLIVVSVINLGLNIILVPRYGLVGASIGTVISWIVLDLFLLFEVKKYLNIVPIRRKMIKIFLISLIPLILLFFMRKILPNNLPGLIITGLIFLISYIILIFATKCLDEYDKLIINKLLFKIYHIKLPSFREILQKIAS